MAAGLVQQASAADATFELVSVAPQVISPDESVTTINQAVFTFSNPDENEISVKIFDITGAMVRMNLIHDSDTTMIWDGRNSEGETVPAGIYIYQAASGIKFVTGTICVAK